MDAGNVIEFGNYPQDSDGDPSPIRWMILEAGDSSLFLLSLWGLESGFYHSCDEEINWSRCDLRRWLNDEFYKGAFTKSEQKRILISTLDNSGSAIYGTQGDEPTEDRLFLLSVGEVENYLPRKGMRLCEATPYAQRQGADMYLSGEEMYDRFYAWWWLRLTSTYNSGCYMYSSGEIYSDFAMNCPGGTIRPALRLKI